MNKLYFSENPIFHLEDLTVEFYSHVIYVLYSWSDGMGGPGLLFMMTDTGEVYELEVTIFERGDFDLPRYIPIMKDLNADPWKQVSKTITEVDYVKKEYYDDLVSEMKEEDFCWSLDVLPRILHKEKKPYHYEAKTVEIWKKEEEKRKEEEAHQNKIRLTKEDYEWKKCYAGNLEESILSDDVEGWYLLLFSRNMHRIVCITAFMQI